MKEKLEFDGEIGRQIAFGDSDDFTLLEDKITSHGRWTVTHCVIVQRNIDLKYFRSHYYVGATESQDQQAYEYDKAVFEEVVPVQKTITVFE